MYKYLFFLLAFNLSLFAENPFKPFTGEVIGNKVRMRTAPNLEGTIISELNKKTFLLVLGEKDNYYAIKPPQDTKVYIFKSYVVDNIIEADRVNVRLKPNLEAPILGQLQKNQTVQGDVHPKENKWLEIAPPENIFFYIAKEYISRAGDSSYISLINQRKDEVEKLLNSAFFLAQAECKKEYSEMNTQQASLQFEAIIKGYSDFPHFVKQAKEGLSLLKDTYLQKKIAYLEKKTMNPSEKEKIFNQISSFEKKVKQKPQTSFEKKITSLTKKMTPKMKIWIPKEKELFSSWSIYNPYKLIDDFYNDQKTTSIYLTGTIKNYDQNIKNKPGNYILKGKTVSIAYLYSTIIDLEKYVDKKITIMVSPRPNNNFAFPAYFVNSVK